MTLSEFEPQYHQRVVSLGGGTGQYSFLAGLRRYNAPECITAIAGTWDDGGDSGRRRVDEGILPPGDARQCLLALCEPGKQMEAAQALFNYRNHREESLGNEIISFFTKWAHGAQAGLDVVRDLLLMDSEVLYVTRNELVLYAETSRGNTLSGESAIDTRYKETDFDPEDRIESIYFDTDAQAERRAINAIMGADKIIIPSGSLYGSLLPHFLIDGISDAIITSKGKLIFVMNLMSERGQTDMFVASDYIDTFTDYLGDEERLEYIIVNENGLSKKVEESYKNAGQVPVELDENNCKKLAPNAQIISASVASFSRRRSLYRHDHRLAKVILDLE